MATRAVLTYADYAALPDDGRRYELHEGELRVTPAPGTRHQAILMNLAALLHAHARAHGLGQVFPAPTDVILSDITVLQPDIAFVATDHMQAISARAIEGPPTLVIEVLSPSTAHLDRGRKRELYAQYRAPWLWIVDPDQRVIEAARLAEGTYRPVARLSGTTSLALPPFLDLVIEPAEVWP
ncbi:MAG: Uma2 family endonuclease [Candidatus Rokubacteria bacterium]|nr:Uma2 family endonuclease [Candidatus Rokubacteria bacterium]